LQDGVLDDLTQLLPPLLRSLEALGFVARNLNPTRYGAVMETVGSPDAALRLVRPRFEAWPEELAAMRERLETAREAHGLGLRSNCTMLYGHLENDEDRADHLVKLRALQDETHGFVTFIPLAFHPDNTVLQHIPKTTGFADIRNIAVARLMLDNIPHVKAYWVMMTPRIAQIALRFGADDIDGTIVEERIYHDAGATTTQGLRRAELLELIRKAGREPVERDTLYRPVERSATTFTVLV